MEVQRDIKTARRRYRDTESRLEQFRNKTHDTVQHIQEPDQLRVRERACACDPCVY